MRGDHWGRPSPRGDMSSSPDLREKSPKTLHPGRYREGVQKNHHGRLNCTSSTEKDVVLQSKKKETRVKKEKAQDFVTPTRNPTEQKRVEGSVKVLSTHTTR